MSDSMLASWGEYGKVVVWDVLSATAVWEVDGYKATLGSRDLVYLSDGSLLANEWPHLLTVWNPNLSARRLHGTEWTSNIALNQDENRVATAGATDKIMMFDPQADWEQVFSLNTGWDRWKNPVTALVFSPGQRLLAAGSHSGAINVYDLEAGQRTCRLREHTAEISVHLSLKGNRYVDIQKATAAGFFPLKERLPFFPEQVEILYTVLVEVLNPFL